MSSREQFEAWWEINYHNGKPPRFGWAAWRDGDGYKIDDDESELDGMWNAWQAATNALEAKCAALAADNSALNKFIKDDCWIWDDKSEEYFDAADCMPETPATDAFLAEVRAQGVTEFASKRGFSFQHGSIHAHFGNGDVMVGSVTFENGDAGINFAPVREKTGGIGTNYEWTKGKTAEQVDSVFVIASSNAEGLEVIRDKLSEAIAQLREDANAAELVAAGIITKVGG